MKAGNDTSRPGHHPPSLAVAAWLRWHASFPETRRDEFDVGKAADEAEALPRMTREESARMRALHKRALREQFVDGGDFAAALRRLADEAEKGEPIVALEVIRGGAPGSS